MAGFEPAVPVGLITDLPSGPAAQETNKEAGKLCNWAAGFEPVERASPLFPDNPITPALPVRLLPEALKA